MTEDYVPFQGRLEFKATEAKTGCLILNRSNASAKPEFDRALMLPVRFNETRPSGRESLVYYKTDRETHLSEGG